VELLLFDRADEFSPRRIIEMDPRTQRTYWHVFVPGVKAGQLYGYRVYGPFDPARGMRFDSTKVLLDPLVLLIRRVSSPHVAFLGRIPGARRIRISGFAQRVG
jgi:pullulanase/glycogen debranching enzyme